MADDRIILVDIIDVKNPFQADLVDIQEMEIEEVLATKIIRDEKVGKLHFKESKKLCKIKGFKDPKSLIEALIMKDGKLLREHHALMQK